MKKVILMVAVAMAALSCANKEAEKAEEAAPAPAAVEAPAPAPAAVEAPAQEETQAQKEASLIERAVELGHDVADEVEKNK